MPLPRVVDSKVTRIRPAALVAQFRRFLLCRSFPRTEMARELLEPCREVLARRSGTHCCYEALENITTLDPKRSNSR